METRSTDTIPLPVHPDRLDDGGGPSDRRVRSALAGARERPVSAADLRAMIAAARADIVTAGTDTQRRMELSHELRKTLAALEPADPDLGPVREHWKRVRELLGPASGHARIAQITDLLLVLLRAAA
jgi:hypothetical protein